MPKVAITRNKPGARVAHVEARVAAALVKGGQFSYVGDTTKVPKPKRASKAKHAASGDDAPQVEAAAQEEAEPEAVTSPMTAKVVTPTRAPARKVMTRAELEEMQKADLKSLGQTMGVPLLASDSKGDFVDKIYRYMRRDMRADR